MALTYGFFDAELVQGQYDRVYGAAEFAQYFSLLIKNGVFPDPSTNLQVKASSPTANMNVNIEAGYGWINGYWAKNDSPYTLTIQPAHGSLNRIDAVVLRWVSSTRSMEFDVLTGTPNASPQVPNLTRTVEIYELMLASITVANGATSIAQASITDKRPDSSVCGWVTSLIENIDTTDLFAQFEDAFETWFDNIKGQLEGDVVTNLQRQIDERVKIEDKATEEEAIAGTNDTKWMTPKTTDVAIKQKANKIGDIVTASYDKEIDSNGEFVKCDGRILLYSEYQEFSDKINRVFGTQIYNSNPDVDLNLKNIETVLSKLYTDSYTYVLHGGSYYYIRKYGTSENTEPNYITTTDRLDTKEATNFVSPMFMDDSNRYIYLVACPTFTNPSIYKLDTSSMAVTTIFETSFIGTAYITGTIKTDTGFMCLIAPYTYYSNTEPKVLNINMNTSSVSLINPSGVNMLVGSTCYCRIGNYLYIQGCQQQNDKPGIIYKFTLPGYDTYTSYNASVDENEVPNSVKRFMYKNPKAGSYANMNVQLSYSDEVSYAMDVNESTGRFTHIYKFEGSKEEDQRLTILSWVNVSTLKYIDISNAGANRIEFILNEENNAFIDAYGVINFEYPENIENLNRNVCYFTIKGNFVYLYPNIKISADSDRIPYSAQATLHYVKGQYKTTYKLFYPDYSSSTTKTTLHYNHINKDRVFVPNLRVIDYIKVK